MVNAANRAQRVTVRARHLSFRSHVGKPWWERSPVTATSPRLSSSACTGQDIAGESENQRPGVEHDRVSPNTGEGRQYFKGVDDVFSLN